MTGEFLKEVRMAQRFYYLAVRFENRGSKGVTLFAKEICNKYTKMAKTMNVSLSSEELIKTILK